MFKVTKCTLTAAAVIAATGAPSTAYARTFDIAPPAPAPAASAQVQAAVTPSAPRPEASSPAGFPWDDAGIGAAGVLGLLGAAGATSLVARRRREHQTPAR